MRKQGFGYLAVIAAAVSVPVYASLTVIDSQPHKSQIPPLKIIERGQAASAVPLTAPALQALPVPAHTAPMADVDPALPPAELARLQADLSKANAKLAAADAASASSPAQQASIDARLDEVVASLDDISRRMKAAGEVLVKIRFAHASTVFTPSAELGAALVEASLKASRVDVVGHADSSGTAAANRRISKARALAAKAFLIEHGVAKANVFVAAHGADQPIASNATEEGRAANRRVEIDLHR